MWEQGSTYLSNNPMTSRQVTRILNDLIRKYPWTIQCMKRCSETDEPPRNRDRMTLFRNAIEAQKDDKKTHTMEEWQKKIAERKAEKEKSAVSKANEKTKGKTEKDRS